MANCSLCGLGSHRYQFPNYSDASQHPATAIACANQIIYEMQRWQDKDDLDAKAFVKQGLDTAVTRLAQYVDTLRNEVGVR